MENQTSVTLDPTAICSKKYELVTSYIKLHRPTKSHRLTKSSNLALLVLAGFPNPLSPQEVAEWGGMPYLRAAKVLRVLSEACNSVVNRLGTEVKNHVVYDLDISKLERAVAVSTVTVD